MRKNLLLSTLILLLTQLLLSCTGNMEFPIQDKVWVPQYSPKEKINEITVLEPKSIENAGKIYVYEDYLYQVEIGKGIHVYKFVDKKPESVCFLQVYGAEDISIRNNILYTNNIEDLVIIDIANPNHMFLVGRTEDVFQHYGSVPPQRGYFQCVDSTKGVVTGWALKENVPASCRY